MNETKQYFPGLKPVQAEIYNDLKLINKHSMLEQKNQHLLNILILSVSVVATVMTLLTAGCGNEALFYSTDVEDTEEVSEITEDQQSRYPLSERK